MKSLWMVLAAASAVISLSAPAQADYIFSGTGSSGTFTGQASEPFAINADGGQAITGYLDNWGSPGVGLGTTPYLEAQSAFGLELTFTGGGVIDAASITIGNGADCAGTTTGGTTFCSIGTPNDIWTAIKTGPHSISFLAQDPSFFLTTGQDFFVNVFFDSVCVDLECFGGAPTSFTGTWLTEFHPSVPEPITLSIFGAGLAGAAAMRRRKRAA